MMHLVHMLAMSFRKFLLFLSTLYLITERETNLSQRPRWSTFDHKHHIPANQYFRPWPILHS